MSREIKFRVYDQTSKDYIVYGIGEVVDEHFGLGIISRIVWWLKGIKHKFIIEQYTGGEDRNGEEIYEGDIVEEDIDFNSKMTDGTFRYKVCWNEDELCWSLDPIGPESIHNDLWELNSSCRVIGNIHEPPKDFRPEHLKRMGVSISKGGEE